MRKGNQLTAGLIAGASARGLVRKRSASQQRRMVEYFVARLRDSGFRERERRTSATPYSMLIEYDPDDRIYVVTVPELPGCMTHGATHAEAAAKGEEAIRSWVAVAKKFGDPIPPPSVHRFALDPDPLAGEELAGLGATAD